jgi:hypothetical protein
MQQFVWAFRGFCQLLRYFLGDSLRSLQVVYVGNAVLVFLGEMRFALDKR